MTWEWVALILGIYVPIMVGVMQSNHQEHEEQCQIRNIKATEEANNLQVELAGLNLDAQKWRQEHGS